VSATKPWLYVGPNEKVILSSIQHQIGEVMRIGALFAQPFMPAKAAEILDVLGVHPSRRDFRFALWGADYNYGRKRPKKVVPIYVFPRLGREEPEEGETMAELMLRRKKEKMAMKMEQRKELEKMTMGSHEPIEQGI
jgi:methionyl-tRNA synthetase